MGLRRHTQVTEYVDTKWKHDPLCGVKTRPERPYVDKQRQHFPTKPTHIYNKSQDPEHPQIKMNFMTGHAECIHRVTGERVGCRSFELTRLPSRDARTPGLGQQVAAFSRGCVTCKHVPHEATHQQPQAEAGIAALNGWITTEKTKYRPWTTSELVLLSALSWKCHPSSYFRKSELIFTDVLQRKQNFLCYPGPFYKSLNTHLKKTLIAGYSSWR